MRFSILIPTFERAALIGQAIESALAQTYADREILVIDDGSNDATQAVASRYAPAVGYLRQENRGKAAAANLGLAAASGDAILVLDDDDLLPPTAVADHAAALEGDRRAEFSYGRYVRFTGQSQPQAADLWDNEPIPSRDPRRLVVRLMERCFLPHPTWAVRREAQLSVGPYDETLKRSQDYQMIVRLARRGEGAFVDARVLYQRQHLALRGPASERTLVEHSIDKWIAYDAAFFRKLDQDWRPEDFTPFVVESPIDPALAGLQRGVILFQRKVYDRAERALRQYRRTLAERAPSSDERRIAAGLLGCQYGLAELADRGAAGGAIADWLRRLDWPLSLRVAFASQTRWRVRAAIERGDPRLAAALFRFSADAFGAAATLAVMGSKYSAGASRWRAPSAADEGRFHDCRTLWMRSARRGGASQTQSPTRNALRL
jgi:glycosyltransferase involved in cell wall biosynthesis